MKTPFALLGLALCLLLAPAVQAQDSYPSKPIKIVVPFPPGGAADNFARLIGQKLGEAWGQAAVIENKPGAGGQIATQAVATAPADGHTLLVVTVGHAVNPSLYPRLPYDTEKDLQPVAKLATVPSVLVVNPAVPAQNLKELLALAKVQPDKLAYASSGNATTSHVAAALLASMAGVQMLHVPYKGSAPALTDLIAGQVQLMIDPLLSSAQHVKAGKLRALAISSATRSPLAPDLPTMAEAGVPGYAFAAWFLLLAPSGTPAPVVAKLNAQVARSLGAADLQERYTAMGAEAGKGTPAELQAFLAAEIRRYARLVKDTGMKAE
ncbi:tripartite tricarboxylate transporter substrate binding protein [Pseudaquabacterium pictum]|uniref:MFS transporter n=1 Tax=Pseudaquabacterium pictum TaxID=2315236 RepID=A0A480ASF6_9BURK|nr:tripartite tricarboxylate transporter substrate binding protein [Rubrivivax pictus]GCL63780.1 MFS transporter [Rubrivivax pictus]